jgi:nitrogen regulatory protein P-II 1
MKRIEAIIKPAKLEEVESALQEIGIEEFMESTIICHGRQKGQTMFYRGDEYLADAVAQVKLEIFSDDDSVEKIIEVVGTIAKTERTGDCRIFVLPFLEAC